VPEPKQTLQGKKFTEEILSWQPRRRLRRRKRNTNRLARTVPRNGPKDYKKPPGRSTSGEAFWFWVASRPSPVSSGTP